MPVGATGPRVLYQDGPAAPRPPAGPTQDAYRLALADALRKAIGLQGWTLEEAAHHIGVDPAELRRWVRAERRLHLDRCLACEDLRDALDYCLGPVFGWEVITEFRLRQRGRR